MSIADRACINKFASSPTPKIGLRLFATTTTFRRQQQAQKQENTAANDHESASPQPPTANQKPLRGMVAGMAGGIFGSLVGLGGGVIIVPLLMALASMTQRMAMGTSLVAVCASGIAGGVTLYTYGGTDAVDIGSAAIITLFAALSARFGAKYSNTLNANALKKLLGAFMLLSAVLVPLRRYLVEKFGPSSDEEKEETPSAAAVVPAVAATVAHSGAAQALPSSSSSFAVPTAWTSPSSVAKLSAIGTVVGFCSGMLGIGGGILLVPSLSIIAGMSQQMVVGTSLASMIVPSIVSVSTHYSLGNVCARTAPFLVLGTVMGSYIGGRTAVSLPEEQLKLIFAIVMVVLGSRQLGLFSLIRKAVSKP